MSSTPSTELDDLSGPTIVPIAHRDPAEWTPAAPPAPGSPDTVLEDRARSWLTINLEGIVDRWYGVVRPAFGQTHPAAEIRNLLHEYVRGLVQAMFLPAVSAYAEQEIGRNLAEVTGGTVEALTTIRVGLHPEGPLPPAGDRSGTGTVSP